MDMLKRKMKQLELVKEERDILLNWLGDALDLLTISVLDNPTHDNMNRMSKVFDKLQEDTDESNEERFVRKGWEIYNEISRWK